MKRVAVFFDYQNCFHCARSTFFPGGAAYSWEGNFWPWSMAELLSDKGPADDRRQLTYVGTYMGKPDPRIDGKTAAAHQRQSDAWRERSPELVIKTRALRYPHGRPLSDAEEKGIDVQLAIDAMLMGARAEYDVAIIASTDTDLLPVIEGVLGLGLEAEAIGWAGLSQKLQITGTDFPLRFVGPRDFKAVENRADYNRPANERAARFR